MIISQKRMGSTASMLCFFGGIYYLCNIGDSPVFLLRDGILSKISCEHTERSAFEQAHDGWSDPHRKFRLTQYLGIFPEESVITPYFFSDQYRPGDRFLICSDGMSDVLASEQIQRILKLNKPIHQVTQLLLDQALQNGSTDNVTVICAEITSERKFSLKGLFR